MEDKIVHQTNGREVSEADINTVGETSGLSDDRVLADLFRMTPFDGSNAVKGVLPYQVQSNANAFATVTPDPVTARGLLIYPHRALIGTRTDVVADAKKNWRDIRSCVSVGSTTLEQSVVLAANVSGNPRWDLVYEVVAIDTNISDTRFFKDPITKAVSASTYVVKEVTTPLLQVVTGTPGASPAKPAIPADAGSNYIVPLAYVLVRNATTLLNGTDIIDLAPALTMSQAMGTQAVRPATAVSTLAGASMAAIPWSTGAADRPGPWMPPTMTGGLSLLVPIQLGSSLTASVADGDVVDNSVDWRRRFFKWTAAGFTGSNELIASDLALNGAVYDGVPSSGTHGGLFFGQNLSMGMGSSFQRGPTSISGHFDVLYLTNQVMSNLGTGTFALYVDLTTGELKAFVSGTVNAQFFIWLEASAQFPNWA